MTACVVSVARDKRGRRVGRNPWRVLVTTSQRAAAEAWRQLAERETRGYETEMREYREHNPMPNLREFLIGLSPGRAVERGDGARQ